MLEDVFVLNLFKINLNDRIEGKNFKLNSPNSIVEVHGEKEGSMPPSLLMEYEKNRLLLSYTLIS